MENVNAVLISGNSHSRWISNYAPLCQATNYYVSW